jgi:hypothetical protein
MGSGALGRRWEGEKGERGHWPGGPATQLGHLGEMG